MYWFISNAFHADIAFFMCHSDCQLLIYIFTAILISPLRLVWEITSVIKFNLLLKSCVQTETSVKSCMPRVRHSLFFQCISGILPLNLETGRYSDVEIDKRMCNLCWNNVVQNEVYFLCLCPFYWDFWNTLLGKVMNSGTCTVFFSKKW